MADTNHRIRIPRGLIAAAVGGSIGLFFALVALVRAGAQSAEMSGSDWVRYALPLAVMSGAVCGFVWHLARALRQRGVVLFYFAWTLVGLAWTATLAMLIGFDSGWTSVTDHFFLILTLGLGVGWSGAIVERCIRKD